MLFIINAFIEKLKILQYIYKIHFYKVYIIIKIELHLSPNFTNNNMHSIILWEKLNNYY